MRRFALVIPAAGSGTRMKSETPKPFLDIGDKPILHHTLRSFSGLNGLFQVIIAVNAPFNRQAEEILKDLFSDTKVSYQLVEGGKERQYSILNGLEQVGDVELVAIHDAVRPFVHADEIEKCCEAAARNGGAILGVRARDTLKKVDENFNIIHTPYRSAFWHAQTPQIFRSELIKKAYEIALKNNIIATDDASLVEQIGGKVKMIEGSSVNIKITYPEDLIFAEHILKKWK